MLKIWNEHSFFDQMSLSSLDSLWLVLNVRTRINREMVVDYKSGAFLNFFENLGEVYCEVHCIHICFLRPVSQILVLVSKGSCHL